AARALPPGARGLRMPEVGGDPHRAVAPQRRGQDAEDRAASPVLVGGVVGMTRPLPVPLLLAALLAPSDARPDRVVGGTEPESLPAKVAPLPVRNLSPLAQVLGLPRVQGER